MDKKIKVGFMFIELLLVLVIIMFLVPTIFRLYSKKSPINGETQRVMSEQGIDTTSPKLIIDSTKKKLQDIQDQRMKDLNNIKIE